MSYKFYTGQKVICVDDRYSNKKTMKHFQNWISRDQVYTVREVRPQGLESGILLEEITNAKIFVSHLGGHIEPAFHPTRFVPVDETEQEKDNKQPNAFMN